VINGDLGLHPGTAVTGFPPGTVNGAKHITDAVALQAKTDLTTAYNDAAGRPFSATSPPDIGGRTLKAGVYRTGSVPSLGLTGNLTLDAQGDPRAVFIFQIASTLTTASASSVSLFKGNILALQSISVNNGVNVVGRLLARNAAVTFINDTVTRAQCAAGTGPGTGGPGSGPGSGGTGSDRTGPFVSIGGPPGVLQPPNRFPRRGRPPAGTSCTRHSFTARIRLRDGSGIRRVKVYLDGKLVRRTKLTRFSLRIRVRGLRVGGHRITVMALDRAGNRSVTRRRFARCALALAAPRFPRFTG
jgi:hypothetical protein